MTARDFLIVFISCVFLSVNAVAQDAQRQRKAENDFLTMVTNYTAARDYNLARKQLTSLVSSDPLNDAAWYYLGMCNLRLGNNKEAIDNLKKAASIDTSNYWYRERLALAYQADGQDELTIDTYERLLKAFPKKTDLYYNLVNLYLRHGQLDKAMDELDNIEGAFGKSEQLAGMRYQILLNQNKPQEAFKALSEHLLTYSKDNPLFLDNLGSYFLVKKDYKKARKYYDQVLKKHPADMTALKNCLLMCRTTKDVKAEKKYLALMAAHGETETDRAGAQARLDAYNRK
jgi:tetratricopeptide (TPR) repeat protein